jgi:hypothetical protein
MMPPIPAGATILKVRLHIYGPLDGILRNVYYNYDTAFNPPPKRIQLDAVCPIH